MKDADLPAVQEIEALSFSNPWSDATFRGEIQNKGISFPMIIVRPQDGRVVGYIMYWQIRDEVQINNVAVHPDFRGKGIGEAAMRLVLKVREKVPPSPPSVRVSNAAHRLYEMLGFKIPARGRCYTNPRGR
jgi:ribosomal-protein-alanine N-acetyltransferase